MTLPLPKRELERLAAICGMFGSAHDGERASAAALADKLVRDLGLTWPEIILPKSKSPKVTLTKTIREQIAFALANLEALSMWERGFLYSINGKSELSAKQLNVLEQIVAKASAYAEGS